MKTKFLAFFMAVLMVLCLAFASCGEKDTDEGGNVGGNVGGNTNVEVEELTAEEYVLNAFKVDTENSESPTSVHIGAGVGNIGAILGMVGADTSAMPPIGDVALDIYSDDSAAAGVVSAIVNNVPLEVLLGVDAKNGTVAIDSELLSATYGFSYVDFYEATTGMAFPTFSTEDQEKLVNACIDIAEGIGELIVNNSTLSKANGAIGKVNVVAEMDSRQCADFVYGAVELIMTNEVFNEYYANMGVDFSELKEEIESDKESFYDGAADAKLSATVMLSVDKQTNVADGIKIDITADEETITVTATETDSSVSLNIAFSDMATVAFDATYSDTTLVCNFDISTPDFVIEAGVDAKNGKGIVTVKVDGEIDYEAVNTVMSMEFDYTVSGKKVELLVNKISVDETSLDLSDAEITVTFETDCNVPEIPAIDKPITDFSENGDLYAMAQELAMNFLTKTGLMQYQY